MRCASTSRSKDTFCNVHTCNVIRRCLFANEHYLLSVLVPFNSFFCCEYNLACTCTRRSVKSFCQRSCCLKSLCFKLWVQKLVKLVWLYASKSCFLCDELFFNHVNCHLNSSCTCALTVAALEHVELSFLNGKLHVLHIVIVLFEAVADLCDFSKNLWLLLLESRNIHWSADTSNNVFTLSVDEVFCHKVVFTS